VHATRSSYINIFKARFQGIFGLSVPLVKNIWPKRVPITVVVGAPITCPKTESPSDDLITEFQLLYIKALEELYNTNKDRCVQR
jgi:2-acylglycerol O-acyltransferase 2